MRPSPTHSLDEIQRLVKEGSFVVTTSAAYTALALGFDDTDVAECVCLLDEGDFHKTMASEKKPGLMQDVYLPRYRDVRLYVKLQLADNGAVVISFKKDQRS